MQLFNVGVEQPLSPLPKEEQLAWRLAEVATARPPLLAEVEDMAINRVIDNAAVAYAAINRDAPGCARAQALAHPREGGASVFGCETLVDAEWACWANSCAIRELDFHDTFLAQDYAHPGDSIPALIAVAQQLRCHGRDLLAAIVTAYEIHIALVRAICLHRHKIDHVAHLAPAIAAGLGTLLRLPCEQIYQAIGQALHVNTATRQSRKGQISSWKAFAPAHAGKTAIEAVDRAMRGQGSPAPIYEGADGVIAWLLAGKDAHYTISLPAAGEPRKAILSSFTKAYSAEYQCQAPIDLAFRLRKRIPDLAAVESITLQTSHHTHFVIGTGSGDPQKMDPNASRETLDHSLMYVFAVALEDGCWHHQHSYAPERARRASTVALWHKIKTEEDPYWNERYLSNDENVRAFGCRAVVKLSDGKTLEDSLEVADAHTRGRSPFARADYQAKFTTLSADALTPATQQGFLEHAARLAQLDGERLNSLFPPVDLAPLTGCSKRGIF